jgi:hypothetical protein
MKAKLRSVSLKLVLFSGLGFLCGCQANLFWFIRNYSDQPVRLILRYDTKKIQHRKDFIPLEEKYVDYKKELLDINDNTAFLLDDSLQVKAMNDSVYEIVIPPRSTVEMSYIIPTDYNYHSNVILEFDQAGSRYSFNTMSYDEKLKNLNAYGSLFLKNLICYDYGKKK